MAYLGYSVSIPLSLHYGHVQLCDMSVSNPHVTPIHNDNHLCQHGKFFAECVFLHVCFEG